MRWLLIAILVVAAVAMLLPVQKIYDDGLWPLTVHISSTAERPIKAVSAEAFVGVESAHDLLRFLKTLPPPIYTREENSLYSAVQIPYLGQPLEVRVPTSNTTSS